MCRDFTNVRVVTSVIDSRYALRNDPVTTRDNEVIARGAKGFIENATLHLHFANTHTFRTSEGR